jgi:predicted amidohydrolase YtcJ
MIEQIRRGGKTPVEILDMAIPHRPAAMMEETSQSAWANSLALRRAGIGAETPDPPGGVIVRDPRTGKPNGLLLESAGDRVFDVALRRTGKLEDLQSNGLRSWGLKQLARNGITSVGDARVYWKRADPQVWLRAEEEGWLTVRATLALWAYPDMEDEKQIARLTAMYAPKPDGLVHFSQIKFYSDGLMSNGAAAMLAPYRRSFLKEIAPLGIGSKTGINYFDEARLTHYITELERVGFDAHIHVLGDRGAREALNAIQSAIDTNGPGVDRRHRLTHLELVDSADISRFTEMGVIADMQVSGEWTLPKAWSYNRQFVGDRADTFIPLRSIYDTGARVTLSSDFDVSSMDPLVGIKHSLMRDPQSLPSLAAAIRAYTLSPAYTLRQEDTTGSIEVGKFADLVVLDENLFEIPVDQISDASVVLTYLQGNEVYRSSHAPS